MAKTFTDSNFADEVLNSEKLSVVDFWAPWCGPCLALGPTIEKLSEENQEVNVGKINVDENPEAAVKYGIRSIPCVIFIKDGKEVDRITGAASKHLFEKKIQELS